MALMAYVFRITTGWRWEINPVSTGWNLNLFMRVCHLSSRTVEAPVSPKVAGRQTHARAVASCGRMELALRAGRWLGLSEIAA